MMTGCDNFKCGAAHLCERYITHKCRKEVKTFPQKKNWKFGDTLEEWCTEGMFIHTNHVVTNLNYLKNLDQPDSVRIDLSSRRTMPPYPHE